MIAQGLVGYKAPVRNEWERVLKIWKKEPERFESVFAVGWEETGAIVLVLVAVAVLIVQYVIGIRK